MSDEVFGSICLMIGTLGSAFFIYLASRRSAAKPTTPPKTPTGEVFHGSPNEGVAIALREVYEMRGQLDEVLNWRRDFTGAVKRYLTKLARAWVHDTEFPTPDDDDLAMLSEILPKLDK